MTTPLTTADAAIRAVAKAAVDASGVAKQFFENMAGADPGTDSPATTAPPWVSVVVQWSDSEQASLGSTGFDRSRGIVTFVIATAIGRGAAPGVGIADAIRTYLRSHAAGSGVTLRPATIRSVGASAGPGLAFWQTNVICPFFVTHRS